MGMKIEEITMISDIIEGLVAVLIVLALTASLATLVVYAL